MENSKTKDLRARFSDRESSKTATIRYLTEAGRQVQSRTASEQSRIGIPTLLGLRQLRIDQLDIESSSADGPWRDQSPRPDSPACRSNHRTDRPYPHLSHGAKGRRTRGDVGDFPFAAAIVSSNPSRTLKVTMRSWSLRGGAASVGWRATTPHVPHPQGPGQEIRSIVHIDAHANDG